MRASFIFVLSCCATVACSSPEPEAAPRAVSAALSTDRAIPQEGVDDLSRDPAVLGLDLGGEVFCAGVLAESDLVLTAASCFERASTVAPESIEVLLGDDAAKGSSSVRGRVVLRLDDSPLAALVLDAPLSAIRPAPVRVHGPARGEHLRSAGYAPRPRAWVRKIVRAHVVVTAIESNDFSLFESGCGAAPGAPALDEATGEIVGVLVDTPALCEGNDARASYARLDVAWPRLTAARDAWEREAPKAKNATTGLRPARSKPVTDYGAGCERGSDCAAGVCAVDGVSRYCSRTCSTGDRCPTTYQCRTTGDGFSACIRRTP